MGRDSWAMTDNPKVMARCAGLLYLLVVAFGGLAQVVGRGGILVDGDAAATAANIVAHETMFRLAVVADVLQAITFVLLGLTLRRLLQHVHGQAAAALLMFVTAGAGIIVLNLAFQVGALRAAAGPDPSAALPLLQLHTDGYVLGGVFFGLWLLPMGFLARKSGYFPNWLGFALLVAGGAWIADPLLAFGLPGAPALLRQAVSAPVLVGEFGLMLYLLIRGVRTGHETTEQPRIVTPT